MFLQVVVLAAAFAMSPQQSGPANTTNQAIAEFEVV